MVLAGPNGAGKSTIAAMQGEHPFDILPHRLDADAVSAEFRRNDPTLDQVRADFSAGRVVLAAVAEKIGAQRDFAIETNLASSAVQRHVDQARAVGFQIALLFIALSSPELAIERVALRRAGGGHHVPDETVIRRYHRSIDVLPWFIGRAGLVRIFDNSTWPLAFLAEKPLSGPLRLLLPGRIPAVDRAVAAAGGSP